MRFSDKLNLLFRITQTKGKDLAAALYITPPQITKMRKGMRGMPKAPDTRLGIARFFAEHTNADEQRDELVQVLAIGELNEEIDEKRLAQLLYEWLSYDDTEEYLVNKAESFVKSYGTLYDNMLQGADGENLSMPVQGSNFLSYYGAAGKRLAVLNFLEYILHRNQPYVINMLNDEGFDWSSGDSRFTQRLNGIMHSLVANGCTFNRIVGQLNDINQAYDSLMRWLVYYLTDKAKLYSYRRMRDNLSRVTIYVAPNIAVLFSFSIGTAGEGVTFFTTDEKTVKVMMGEYHKYAARCEPFMDKYSTAESPAKLHACMLSYERTEANCIQLGNSLSFITLPWDIALSLSATDDSLKSVFLTSMAQRHKVFLDNLQTYTFIDILKVADFDTIVQGREPIRFAGILGGTKQYYTAATYAQHLNSIVYLLKHYPNYRVYLLPGSYTEPTLVYAKEAQRVIVARDSYPFHVYSSTERDVVYSFSDNLKRFSATDDYLQIDQYVVINRLNKLIRQLEKVGQ